VGGRMSFPRLPHRRSRQRRDADLRPARTIRRSRLGNWMSNSTSISRPPAARCSWLPERSRPESCTRSAHSCDPAKNAGGPHSSARPSTVHVGELNRRIVLRTAGPPPSVTQSSACQMVSGSECRSCAPASDPADSRDHRVRAAIAITSGN